MRVTCFLCDRVDEIDDNSLLAKRIRNRPLTTYLCPACHDRIAQKTLARRQQKQARGVVQAENERGAGDSAGRANGRP